MKPLKRIPRVLILVCLILSLAACSGCKAPSFGNEISAQQETQIGQQESSVIESDFRVVTDPEIAGPVQAAADRILPLAHKLRPEITFRIRVLQSAGTNTFSIAGGWIYIDEGLLQRIGNDQNIIGCLVAHEAAHVILRHSVTRLADAYGKAALVDLLTQGGYQEASDIAAQLDVINHSRQEEYDADKLGIALAARAGYDPMGMLKFFTMLQQQAPNEPNAEWMSTHPVTDSRIKRAEEDVKKIEAGK